MRIFKLLLVFMLALILVTGCDEDDKNPVGTDFPTNLNNLETVMIITPWQDLAREASILIWTTTEPTSSSLEINGTIFDLDWEYFGTDWETWLYYDGTGGFGDTFNYELVINNNTITGSVEAPFLPDITWPDFNFNQNYAFDWELPTSPDLQFIEFYLETMDNEYFEEWEIAGSERSYEINKSYYQDYSNTYTYMDIGIMPVNFNLHNSGNDLVFANTYEGMYLETRTIDDFKRIATKIMQNR
ncbi:MAG: hypothetical protein K9N09_03660 [Candidatus Cloacimonetes bacterium]|nr:hypothetical protein [Candidatus Cloacimonadota bacterium]MCF7814559.1 hypothetical protein [Candidatus Cloacimonadota bacterium]MCF7867775.1 hypothetical protein [Candidatus Cloacimonadota bacterium]MCF7883247.1 hypothetical protein [Candidatus Cloacimonadota bacterium]